ncbi:hypothetical protein GQX74_010361, partial [Glossina fuscipes]
CVLTKNVQRNSGNQTKCQLHCVCINIVADGQWRALIGKRKAINRPKTALLRNSKWTATTSKITTTTTTCCQWSLVKQQHDFKQYFNLTILLNTAFPSTNLQVPN